MRFRRHALRRERISNDEVLVSRQAEVALGNQVREESGHLGDDAVHGLTLTDSKARFTPRIRRRGREALAAPSRVGERFPRTNCWKTAPCQRAAGASTAGRVLVDDAPNSSGQDSGGAPRAASTSDSFCSRDSARWRSCSLRMAKRSGSRLLRSMPLRKKTVTYTSGRRTRRWRGGSPNARSSVRSCCLRAAASG